jgi:aspartokinase-like uncharacterized kinase
MLRSGTIVKLGGSLYEWALFPETWVAWRRSRPPEEVLWVVPGGGGVADYVRHLQKLHRFSDPLAHQMALESMNFHGRWLHSIFAVSRHGKKWVTNLLDFDKQYKKADPANGSLPEDWTVTSDAVALRLGIEGFEKIVFLKSVGPKQGWGLQEAMAQKWVDDWTIANGPGLLARAGVEVEWVNLRGWAKGSPGLDLTTGPIP